ncbi:hypothetical protein MLD38_010917 [Melastoma candidum]|uniref:Uncharacterized protein n=1 Tax=Melastoma candidum TaxID=119954 RepID=A0ACB9R1D9_9MYRT|nr:hypothetical protein MLD38_010917 [Melastoma candidum]
MSSANATSHQQPPPPPPPLPPPAAIDPISTEELAAKAVNKRYEGLVMVRTKAIKGKGAWYWAHLEPLLVRHSGTNLPKAVKLRCSLCEAVFSASNPSRTASEHLKRGTCPNFSSSPRPISSIMPSNAASPGMLSPQPSSSGQAPHRHPRKWNGGGGSSSAPSSRTHYDASPLSMVEPSGICREFTLTSGTLVPYPLHPAQTEHHIHHHPPPHLSQQHLVLSGGKDDLGALAVLEDNVKKLKSPKTSPGLTLSKAQIDLAFDYLVDWVYESWGLVSFSSLEHPKFRSFLNHVGLPAISMRDFAVRRLDSKYEEARAESEVRIRDAMFFQVASDGWKCKSNYAGFDSEENLVNFTVNLPNGTSLFQRVLFVSGSVPSKYAEDVIWETVGGICGNEVQQCVGVVADKFKTKALRDLEARNHWMVNLSCQVQGLSSLIKDFGRELPLFRTTTESCLKLAKFVNNDSEVRRCYCKYLLQEHGHCGLLRVPLRGHENLEHGIGPVFAMLEDVLNSSRVLQLLLMDESYKMMAMEDPLAAEVADLIGDMEFWNDVEAMHSLIRLVKSTAREVELERPLVGQCLPIWNNLTTKVKGWCLKYHVGEGIVEKVVERRFLKNYHPAWAAAFVLDPINLVQDTNSKYLPPFKHLTPEQDKDIHKLITRLVAQEEAPIALMELMKWRTMGLDPVYAQAVQMKELDPLTGKMRIAHPPSSRLVWETHLTEFKSLGKVAVRLIFLHATSTGFKCNTGFLRRLSSHARSREGMERAQKLVFIAAHSRLNRPDFSADEDRDAEVFSMANGGKGDEDEDVVMNDVTVDESTA